MSIPIPLAVRLKTSRSDRYVTRDLRDLEFRSVAPGGFASAVISLNRPLSIQPDEIDYYGNLYVYDRRNGVTVWEGRLEDPGRSAGGDGQVWDISAVGPSAHASDRTVPYIAADRQYTSFKESSFNQPYARWASTNDDNDPGGGLQCTVARGTVVPASADFVGDTMYQQMYYAGMKIARLRVEWDIGFTDTAWELQLKTRTNPGGAGVTACSQTASPAGGSLLGKLTTDGGNIVLGNNVVSLRTSHPGGSANTIPDELCWFQFNDWSVKAVLMDRTGTEITTGYSGDTYTSDQIVIDLIARFCPKYDLVNAVITTGSFGINQFAYYDGNPVAKMLDDLMLLEPAYYWAAWESNAAGLYRFEWTTWPTAVSYDADITDGFDSPSSAVDLYNAVRVRYQSTSGLVRNLQRSQTVTALANAGLTREAWLDLGDNIGSTANAQQAGDQFLAEHATPPNAGKLIVASPVADLVNGRMVQPWEIRPGRLIRVRGVQPRVNSLNPSGRDGVTVFKVKAVTYRASTAVAELELDSYPVSTARALAAIARKPPARRR